MIGLLAGEDAGLTVLGDTGYGGGKARAGLAAAGHNAVIKPGPLRPAVAGGFTIDDFAADEAAGTATWPNGVTRRKVTFGAACQACPLRPMCTTRAQGRVLSLHEHDAISRRARRDWAAREDFRDTYRQHRPMVERSIAWLIGPKGRCRQLRYRGIRSNDQWLHTRMAALNLRKMINLGLQPAADANWFIAGVDNLFSRLAQKPDFGAVRY